MMLSIKYFPLVITIFLLDHRPSLGQFDPSFCTPLPANLTNGPGLPKLHNQYFTTVEWREKGSSKSVYVLEYFDEPGQRTAVKATGFYDPGDTVTTLIFYKSKERIVIQDGSCKSNTISAEGVFGFPFTKGNKTAYLLNANDAIEFGRSFNETYLGTDTIRDIPVNHWRSCGYHGFLQTTVEIDFYFSIAGQWTSPSGVTTMPIRSIIRRRESITVLQPSQTIVISETDAYDYVYFQEGLPSDLTVFQIPDGIYCQNRPTDKTMPQVADYFSFKTELTFSQYNVTGILNVWYDYKAQIVRVDSENIPSPNIATGDTTDPMEEIHDFFSGLSYTIDRDLGICHVTPISIQQSDFDVRYMDPNHVTIKAPQQFFDLGKRDFQYVGQRTVRSIPCDVWTAMRTNYPPNSNETTVWEWYFSRGNWTISQASGNHIQRPLKVVITFLTNNAKLIYNIFDFDTKRPSLSSFNVHSCYNETDIRYVRLNFTGPLLLASPFPDLVRESAHLALQKAMNVSPLRVIGVQIFFDNYALYIGFVLFGPPKVDGKWAGKVNMTALDDAFNNLIHATNQGTLTFTVDVVDNIVPQMAHFHAVPHSARVAMKDDNGDIVDIQQTTPSTFTATRKHSTINHSSPQHLVHTTAVSNTTSIASPLGQSQSSTGVSGGAVAGIAIAMVIVGLLLGSLGVLLYIRRRHPIEFEMFQLK